MSTIETALAALDLETKVSLLAGQDVWSLPAVPHIGLGSLVMSDGPIGVRGTSWGPDDPAVVLPSPTALAATWDPALARRVGRLLAQEARRKGAHLLLAPTVNLHRTPLGGRHFECYSEDPLLTAEIGVGYVRGVQDGGVGATVKHFVANDSETARFVLDAAVDDRTLREVYLAPFEAIVNAGVWAVMCAYNGVNGHTMSENDALQNGLLKGEWGFDGVVVSDWTAAKTTAATALGGLDVAMPGPGNPWGPKLVEAVRAGEVPESVVDEMVRRVLRLAGRVGLLEGVEPAVPVRPEAVVDGDALAEEVASRSFVLLRNDGTLPLASPTVALIGVAAEEARILGGGSVTVFPPHVVSPLDGLRAQGVELTYEPGVDPRTKLPPAYGPEWTDPETGEAGFRMVFRDASGAELGRLLLEAAVTGWTGKMPAGVDGSLLDSVELSAWFRPLVFGEHRFGVGGIGEFVLTVDGEVLYDDKQVAYDDDPAAGILLHPETRVATTVEGPVLVTLRHKTWVRKGIGAVVGITLGHAEPGPTDDELIQRAVVAAAAAQVAVVVVATTEEVESEGFDRRSLALPGRQDDMVAAVAAANPRTVVVVNAGSPVEMPWVDDVAAVLLTWFPGQEAGAALASVLFGHTEPAGRLPTTWPVRMADCPVLDVDPVDGVLAYREGLFIGYRAWERRPVAPAFWFGAGLGYTTWDYESVTVTPSDALATVTVSLRNTGARSGREVVQVYLVPDAPAADRPSRWLAGFASVEAGAGEVVEVVVELPRRSVEAWEDGAWVTLSGGYTVDVGHDYGDTRLSAALKV
ncbi:glycoside hydrolase family 3 C-terminal domain-containing protein [Umezawaea endophytica]|uniref:Glycoside hydrolase family 3 C-terminal domain-containing protein n=1 Tax=Umezawaea endophytica TaxID=1654476 RepID=A0A9X2VR01_9PSEU|nr:glycoside hydrolase family 3 C-terminal domain-containing protein [Umezawaea endophytica]MCS7481106.1 glycoside hydrolase family 3 C-terminal domain-containing protein [Umezawaea endophytica]